MNVAARERNGKGMSRGTLPIALVLVAALCGCGGASAHAAPVRTGKSSGLGPIVSARISPRVGWPFRVDHVALTLDGAPLPGDADVLVAPGDHTVVAFVELSLPCDALGASTGHVHMRSVRTFAAAPGDDVSVDLALVDHGALVPVAERLALALATEGANGERGAISSELHPECAGRTDARDHAACVLGPMLATARAIGDATASTCLESALAGIAEPHLASERQALERDGLACIAWAPLEDADQVASDCGLAH